MGKHTREKKKQNEACSHTAHAYKCHNTGNRVGVCPHQVLPDRCNRFGFRRRQNDYMIILFSLYAASQAKRSKMVPDRENNIASDELLHAVCLYYLCVKLSWLMAWQL